MDSVLCPACSSQTQIAFEATDLHQRLPGQFPVSVCESCGTGVTLPAMSVEELGRYYSPAYYTHVAENPLVAALKRVEAAIFDRRLGLHRGPTGRLLEIGPGNCSLLVRMRDRGWDVTGMDTDPLVVEKGRSLGLRMKRGSFTDIEDGPYDLIIAWQSLEHSITPEKDVDTVAHNLAPGGRFLIGIPDFGSAIARYFGRAWSHLDVPRHRSHFTRAGLSQLLERNGMTPVAWSTWMQPYAVLASWRFRQGRRPVRILDAALSWLVLSLPAALLERAGFGDLVGIEATRKNTTRLHVPTGD